MIICEIKKCTGCSACINICSHQAIVLKENTHGFSYPQIDESKCVNCNRCRQVCPVNYPSQPNEHIQVYAALVKNDAERAKSTSGGIFACLAKRVIRSGGYVYGAILDSSLMVKHIEVHTFDELDSLRNSKYVQSDIGLCYRQAKQRLQAGKTVLFSGTPCQIAGLRNYLKREYQNLLTIDILCHGVPSPGLFRKYVNSEEEIAKSKMTNMLFRSKVIGWKKISCVRTFENGRDADWGDTFVPGFLKDYFLRESCYSCVYATDKRQGDITLGDYWGYRESAPDYIEDDDKGISLVIINTPKGETAYKNIRREIASAKRTMEDAKHGNPILYKSSRKPEKYNEFWKDANKMSWGEIAAKYITPQDSKDWVSKELREYYDLPFVKRHRMHKRHMYLSRAYHKLKRIGGKK